MAEHRILVVDDEDTIRFVLRSVVSEMGHEVEAVGSAEEVFEIIAHEQFSAAILDLVLPDGNGIALLDHIKKTSPDTEVLLMTGQASVETAIEAIRKGAYDYLNKPFDIDEVAAVLARALNKRDLSLNNRRLVSTLEHQNQELAAAAKRLASLNEAGIGMSTIRSIPEILEFFMGLVVRELEVDRASIMLSGESGDLSIAAAHGIDDETIRATRVRPGDGIVGRVFETGQPILVENLESSPQANEPRADLSNSYISAPIVLSVPITGLETVLGAINVTNRRRGRPLNQDDLRYLLALAGQAAAAIERSRQEQMLTDRPRSSTTSSVATTPGDASVNEAAAQSFKVILEGVEAMNSCLDGEHTDFSRLREALTMIEQHSRHGAFLAEDSDDSKAA